MTLPLLILLIMSEITLSMGDNGVPKVIVEEGSNAMLPCSLGNNENLEQKAFDWKKNGSQDVFLYSHGAYYGKGRQGQHEQFKGRVFHFPEELKNGNATIVIRNTTVADGGNYTCIFPNSYKTYVLLIVRAAPMPHITILNATGNRVPLLCEVGGAFPEPTLEWKDSDGNFCPAGKPQVSERGGRYFVSLLATVAKTTTNRFRCFATQEDIHHRTHADIDVPEKMFEESKLSVHVGFLALAFVIGVFMGALLTGFFIRICRKDPPQHNGAVPCIILTDRDAPNGNVVQEA